MQKQLKGFVWIGLGVALLLALFISPFASSSPDGLERVAEDRGFLEKGEGPALWKHAPFSDYAIPGIKNETLSTAFSGLIGTLAIFFIALGIGKILNTFSSGKKLSLWLTFLLFLFFFSSSAYAAHPLITDDTGTQGKGNFQIELNGEVGYNKESEYGVTEKARGGEVATCISYGVTDNIDIVFGIPFQWFKEEEEGESTYRQSGFSDFSLELKWRFYEKDGWSFALKPGLSFPIGNEKKGSGSGKVGYSAFLITTKEIEPFAFHFNLGYMRNENKRDNEGVSERKDIWHISLASEWEMIKNLKLVADIGAERNPDKGSNQSPAFLLGGLIYSLMDNLDLDIGVKGGLNRAETDITFLSGIALRF